MYIFIEVVFIFTRRFCKIIDKMIYTIQYNNNGMWQFTILTSQKEHNFNSKRAFLLSMERI